MRIDMMDGLGKSRPIGAAVVRASGGEVLLELGPADGPPHLRLTMSMSEATRLSATVTAVANGKDEEILIVEH